MENDREIKLILPLKRDYPRSIDPPSSSRTSGDFLYFICIFLELRYIVSNFYGEVREQILQKLKIPSE
jgi:hypothetical protein